MKTILALLALGLASMAWGATSRADPWPRRVTADGTTFLIFQPQVESWTGNVLTFRAAISATKDGSEQENLGVFWMTARTQVDKISRMVSLEDLNLTKRDFPTRPDNGISYILALSKPFGPGQRTVGLDRLEASLSALSAVRPAPVAVINDPPRIIVRNTPAILVPIDGAPALRPVPRTNFERVLNTRALILVEKGASTFCLHVYDGWLCADSVAGPWQQPAALPQNIDAVGKQFAATGVVDMLDGGSLDPKPSLANGVPAIEVSETPAELIVFQGPPAFTPIAGTKLERASNTTADVFLDAENSRYYVLLAGRWFSGPALAGPWTFVPSNSLPLAFRKIPVHSPAGVVLASVAGTPQAEEALIANSIPQTATVQRTGGPTFAPAFDGAPQLSPIDGTPLQHVVNSPTPIIVVDERIFYALRAGVWFSAASLSGPWAVAATVPAVIYTIPSTSALHYVTYVQVYGWIATEVYVGYTPGYLGTVVAPDGVVVYGTGYMYPPWIGNSWYPPPATYGVAAQPVYNPVAGRAFGFAMGVTTATMMGPLASYETGAYAIPYYDPSGGAYPCCGVTSASIYGQYGDGVAAAARSPYTSASGAVTYDAGAKRYDDGASQSGSEPEGREGARAAPITYTNPKTGKQSIYGAATVANNVYANRDGKLYKNTMSEWQQYSATGWSSTSDELAWADKEAEARGSGESKFAIFSQSSSAKRSGGIGPNASSPSGWSHPSGGGGGWGDRFGESGGYNGGAVSR